MKLRSRWLWSVFLMVVCVLMAPQFASADKLELKDGTQVDGIIMKVEKGQVTMTVDGSQKEFSILDVVRMDFDTPHAPAGVSPASLEHFASNTEAQEMIQHIAEVDKAAADLRQLLDQAKKEWGGEKTITASETPKWDATKDQFSRALSRYQEVLGDFYAHIVTKVDQYDRLTKEAGDVRVGVQGAFNVGSSLVSKEAQLPPLKTFMPGTWYDTIFYRGYSQGYTEGYYGARPREFVAPQ